MEYDSPVKATPMKIRPALTYKPLPDLIKGSDTTRQAAENRRRVTDYCDHLRTHDLGVPADPQCRTRISTQLVRKEAGVSPYVLRPGSPGRKALEACAAEVGLSFVTRADCALDDLTISDAKARLEAQVNLQARRHGVKRGVMSRSVAHVIDLAQVRAARDNGKSALPIFRLLSQEARDDELDVDQRTRNILIDIETWLAIPDLDEENDLAFAELLQLASAKTGLTQTIVAQQIGVKAPVLGKWLAGTRVPNAVHFGSLQTLETMAGLRAGVLKGAIRRLSAGSGVRVPLADFPLEFRSKTNSTLRRHVREQLSLEADDFAWLGLEALRSRIAALCAVYAEHGAEARARKKMRDANRIDRARFSETLIREITELGAHFSNDRRLANASKTSYLNFVEGFLSFALSDAAPDELRACPETASIALVGSARLFRAYRHHLLEVGSRQMDQPDFRIARALSDRLKMVIALLHPSEGYFASRGGPAAFECLTSEQLGALAPLGNASLELWHLQNEVRIERVSWSKNSRKPLAARDTIQDLLALENPMIAAWKMIAYQRRDVDRQEKFGPPRSAYAKSEGAAREVRRSYAIALRKLVMLHLLAQTALRIDMLEDLTVGVGSGAELTWDSDSGRYRLHIAAARFKNRNQSPFMAGDYEHSLRDSHCFHRDLSEYLKFARPRLLEGDDLDTLFVARANDGSGAAKVRHFRFRQEIREISTPSIGAGAPKGERLIKRPFLSPHHFRDMLATSVLRATNGNFALAADAIHVTESTCRESYGYETPTQRQPQLDDALDKVFGCLGVPKRD